MSQMLNLIEFAAPNLACSIKPTCKAGLHVTGHHPGRVAHLLTQGCRHRTLPLHAMSCTMFSAHRLRTCTPSGRRKGMPASACMSAWCLAVPMQGGRRSAPIKQRRTAGK